MPRRNLLFDVSHTKYWMGLDDTRGRIVERHRTPCWLAPLAELDAHPDDAGRLRRWVRDGCRPDAPRPWPRLFPVRWRDHYTALEVSGPGADADARLFDSHAGPLPTRSGRRWHAAPPLDALRAELPRLRLVHDPVRASQCDPADTLCVVWITLYLCGAWRPGMGLADTYAFMLRCVRTFGDDFRATLAAELAVTNPWVVYRCLRRSSAGMYRRQWHTHTYTYIRARTRQIKEKNHKPTKKKG